MGNRGVRASTVSTPTPTISIVSSRRSSSATTFTATDFSIRFLMLPRVDAPRARSPDPLLLGFKHIFRIRVSDVPGIFCSRIFAQAALREAPFILIYSRAEAAAFYHAIPNRLRFRGLIVKEKDLPDVAPELLEIVQPRFEDFQDFGGAEPVVEMRQAVPIACHGRKSLFGKRLQTCLSMRAAEN